MAAPVHRFAAVDCPPRRPHRPHHRTNGQPAVPAVHTSRRNNEEPSLYVEVPPEPPQPTIASLAAARSVTPDTLLRTAALGLHHSPMIAPHLKFGMMVSFALASIFLAGARYYFDKRLVRETGGNEASLICAAVVCVCGVGCALTLCRPRPPALRPPERVSSTAVRDRLAARPSPPESEDMSLSLLLATRPNPPSSTSESSEAPPPYHIAVLLPPRDHPDIDRSPPAYSALS